MAIKLLTVDDSKTIRMVIQKAFKNMDCKIFEAANGVEGLAVAAKEKPDLIILDITMPIMDGYETLTKLKSSPDLKGIPVIMLTAEAGKENVLRIAKLGVRDYLIKPFKEDLVVERVGRIIDLKPKGASSDEAKRYDDKLAVLVVDDKPAICEQIKNGLSDTGWEFFSCAQKGEAIDFCNQRLPDLILVSLTLSDNGGFTLFQVLRASPKTKNIPVFGMCVKNAAEEQARAQQIGFTSIVTKPIDIEELKGKVCKALNLDTSYKYFQQKEGVLVIALPSRSNASIYNEISHHLRNQMSDAVDSGIGKVILDMSQLQTADITVIKLGLEVKQTSQELGLKQRVIGNDAVCSECKNYEETSDWAFASSYEDALAALNSKEMADA